ncbi:hypothetical protein RHMOL_Rhmol02G0207400 [Rhododendron molle]|uniref:Uncharacterized protein n=1 Tax=Rhododendron molle TaxID=49168 RepID=A0ACC0PTY3_RHOML|nr:hypothetical protein RHMOL_Rhmol02G0207400 [Rhododendron molle]
MGLVKESSQGHHTHLVRINMCSKDMFKDLAEFHKARTYPKEDAGSLFKGNAKGEDMLSDEINPKGKRVHPVDGAMLCSCKTNKGSTLNPQFSRRTQPRTFSCFFAPLASIYEKPLNASSIKPLNSIPLPKNPPANFKTKLYCTYHQMPGHSTNACYHLRHAIQDLIDNDIISAPLPSKANAVSNSFPQPNFGSQVGQVSIISTQINSTSTQIKPTSTIFNQTHYIFPEIQPKPIVSIPSEPKINMMAIGWAIKVFTADT